MLPSPTNWLRAKQAAMPLAAALLLALAWYIGWVFHEPPAAGVAQAPKGFEQPRVVQPPTPSRAKPEPALPRARAANTAADSAAVLSLTSLDGTQPDGDWAVDASGHLRANRALRQRFDYYLSLLGERSVGELRQLLLGQAKRELKPQSAEQVMQMWDRYVQLQQHAWQTQVDVRDWRTWSAALVERQTLRRQILDADWAAAFYADEEAQLQNMIAQFNSGAVRSAMPELALPPQPLHPDAAARELQWQAHWQQWEQRLAEARQHIDQLQQAANLSALQRQQATETYLASQFQGTELVRARALLGL
jgi:lipase chaperone LimK